MAKTKTTTAKVAKEKKTTKSTKATKAGSDEIQVDRRVPSDRREKTERRVKTEPVNDERRNDAERRKAPRRRQIDPTTCERDYSDAEIEFMQAMDDYKRANGRMFPTCSEILEVLQKLGYEKVAAAEEGADLENVTEAAIAEDAETLDETDLDLEQPPADEEI